METVEANVGRRLRVWIEVCAFLAPVLVFVGGNVLAYQMALVAGRRWWLIAVGASMILAAMIGLILCRIDRKNGRKRLAWGSIGSTLVGALAVGVIAPALFRGRIGACDDIMGLQWVVEERYMAIEKGQAWRSLLARVLDDADPAERFRDRCSCCYVDEVTLGDWTLQQYLSGEVSREAVEESVRRADAATPDWERVGPFVVCKDAKTLKRFFDNELVILAYSLPLRVRDWQPMIVVFSDGGATSIHSERSVRQIEEAIDRAKELGLAVPPDDVAGHARRLLGL